jgi:hypothetical protein
MVIHVYFFYGKKIYVETRNTGGFMVWSFIVMVYMINYRENSEISCFPSKNDGCS